MIEIALYQPDIAANAGTIARMCACFDLNLTIIEPAGFVWSDSAFRRAGMDYLDVARISRASSWEAFRAQAQDRRLVLLTTKANLSYTQFDFVSDDIIVLGRESSGVPDSVRRDCYPVVIPMQPGLRSLNVAVAASMVTGEALRQLGRFPPRATA